VFKQLPDRSPPKQIGRFLKSIDFDAVIDERFTFGEGIKRLLENQTTGLDNPAQLDDGTRHGIDTVIEHPMHRVFDSVDHVVEVGRERLNVLRIEVDPIVWTKNRASLDGVAG